MSQIMTANEIENIIGESTQNQDQSIVPTSLRTMNATCRSHTNPIPDDEEEDEPDIKEK